MLSGGLEGTEHRGRQQESHTLVDWEGNISQGIKEHQSQNVDLQLGFMSKIRANSCPGIKSHPRPGLWDHRPPATGRGPGSFRLGPLADVAGMAFIPGCSGTGEAAMGGGPAAG